MNPVNCCRLIWFRIFDTSQTKLNPIHCEHSIIIQSQIAWHQQMNPSKSIVTPMHQPYNRILFEFIVPFWVMFDCHSSFLLCDLLCGSEQVYLSLSVLFVNFKRLNARKPQTHSFSSLTISIHFSFSFAPHNPTCSLIFRLHTANKRKIRSIISSLAASESDSECFGGICVESFCKLSISHVSYPQLWCASNAIDHKTAHTPNKSNGHKFHSLLYSFLYIIKRILPFIHGT